jgi:hypothetical protein
VNGYDTVLEWASELGAGSWQAWREVCHGLNLGANTAARKLAALGHVEFDWVDNRFAAAPPAAVLTLRSSGCLLLTGGRRRSLRARLEQLYAEGDYSIDLRAPVRQDGGPQTWLLEVCAEEARPDPRFPRARLNAELGRFEPNVEASRDGLWWVEEYRRAVAFIRREGMWYRVTTREYGPFLAYPDRSFITYRSGAGVLSVDNQAPLPPLVARAATLQSGRLAKREGASRQAYVNIDPELGELIEDRLDAFVRWE